MKIDKKELIELFNEGKTDKELMKIFNCSLKGIQKARKNCNLSREKPYNREDYWQLVNCCNCNKEFEKSKNALLKFPLSFCSQSCAATFTNKTHPKRKLVRTCVKCDKVIANYRTTFCLEHLAEYKMWSKESVKLKTVGEYRNKESVKNKHPSWKHSHVRNLAKTWLKELRTLPCANCGYDKHVELCHIKGISQFDDNAVIGEINNEENIIQLCPNCHWELDNGLLSLNKL